MISFVEKPNLPADQVKTVICGTDDERIMNYFRRKGISVLKNSPNPYIGTAVSAHADMAVLHLGNERIIVDKNQTKLIEALTKLDMNILTTEKNIAGEYPDDIGLNFAFCNNYVLGNFAYCDKAVLDSVNEYKKIAVKQGYCKCSVLVVADNAIITDDSGIYKKALENGLDALLISKGDISLDGHPYGFIGGSSGKISKDKVVFFGDIKKHRDSEKIIAFIFKYGVSFDCTDDGELRDIGGIVPIIQQA